jgi:hypothetical protein
MIGKRIDMKPIETVTHIIGRQPAVVAEALLAPDNAVKWQSNLERCELVAGRPGNVGSIVHLHFAPKGRRHVMEEVLEFAEPGCRYVSRITGDGMIVTVETILKATPQGTQLTVRWSGSSSSFWTRLLLRMVRGAIAQRAEIDMQTFKRLVEMQGARLPSN